jgi:O-antigen ligase
LKAWKSLSRALTMNLCNDNRYVGRVWEFRVSTSRAIVVVVLLTSVINVLLERYFPSIIGGLSDGAVGVLRWVNFAIGYSMIVLASAVSLTPRRLQFPVLWVLFGAVLLFIASLLSWLVRGDDVSGVARASLIPLIVFVLISCGLRSFLDLAQFTVYLLLLYVVITFASVLLCFGCAVELDYNGGILSWFTLRLHGLSGHANNLGTLAAFGILLFVLSEVSGRYSNIARFFILSSLFGVLVLSQSKTAWLALAISLSIGWLIQQATLRRSAYADIVGAMSAVALIGVGVVVLYLLYVSNFSLMDHFRVESNVQTLTGRTVLWAVSLDHWQNSKLFGLGAAFFDSPGVFSPTLGFIPGHGHNQFIDQLVTTGYFGLFSLLVYLFGLVYCVIFGKVQSRYRAFLIAGIAFFFLRSITQSPFRGGFDEIFLVHVLFLGLLITGLCSRAPLAETKQGA